MDTTLATISQRRERLKKYLEVSSLSLYRQRGEQQFYVKIDLAEKMPIVVGNLFVHCLTNLTECVITHGLTTNCTDLGQLSSKFLSQRKLKQEKDNLIFKKA